MHPTLTHRTPHQPFAAAPSASSAPTATRAAPDAPAAAHAARADARTAPTAAQAARAIPVATPPPPAAPTLSIRIDAANPDHHLWQNHGWWWIHYVVHRGNRKQRIRRSLQTRDVAVARRRRDECFARLRTAAAAAAANHAPSAPKAPAADSGRAPSAA